LFRECGLLLLVALLLVFSPYSTAATGSYLLPANVRMSGPLVSRVVFTVCTSDTTCSGELLGGGVQAAEWTFSIGAWTSLCPPPIGSGNSPTIICGSGGLSYLNAQLMFNYVKFPGSDVHFRRAMQFLQDYPYIQSTVLQSSFGQATNTPVPCFAYASACNPSPMNVHYGTSTNLEAAGEELEQVAGLFCDNMGTPCSGAYSHASEWCLGAPGNGDGKCDSQGASAFEPNLFYRDTYYRSQWAAAVLGWASEIGLTIDGRFSSYGGEHCFYPNLAEIEAPGVYNPSTGYNSVPVINSTAVALDECDMYTLLWLDSGPSLVYLMNSYNSQYYGSNGNPANIYDDPSLVTPADSVAGYPTSTPHTTLNNLDYDTNQVAYATDLPVANAAAKSFMTAYALQVPSVFGYYVGSALFADNANAWTGFALEPIYGPNQEAGLYYSLLNAHQCGASSCEIGAPNGGTLGGTFGLALQDLTPQVGLNPLYWNTSATQQDVRETIYDTPLIVPPTDLGDLPTVDYMTSSHTSTDLPGQTVLGTGSSWFYYQQPCASPNPASTYQVRLSLCDGHSAPGQHPGALERGIGLSQGDRTITDGRMVSMTFRSGLYFSDGVQVHADDYMFSLYLWDVGESPGLPDVWTDATFGGALIGSNGLIAAHMVNSQGKPCSVNCPTIELFMGSQSIWTLGLLNVPVLPEHVWKYFSPDHFATEGSTVDTMVPYGMGATAYTTMGSPSPPLNSWIWYLPNLEIGSGPFVLNSWNTASGTGEIDANPSYFNPNWQAEANATQVTLPYIISTQLIISVYNPNSFQLDCGPAAPGPILPGTTGICQIVNAAPGANRLKVFDGSGTLWRSLPIVKNPLTGIYTAMVPAGLARLNGRPCSAVSAACYSMPSGDYYAVLQTTYSFHGQLRTWYQVFGFSVS
jgi:hypothetical protein